MVVGNLVEICFPETQIFDDLEVTCCGRVHERCGVCLVHGVHIHSSLLHEIHHRREVPGITGPGETVIVQRCTLREGTLDDQQLPLAGCMLEDSDAFDVCVIDIRVCIQELLNDLRILVQRRCQESSPSSLSTLLVQLLFLLRTAFPEIELITSQDLIYGKQRRARKKSGWEQETENMRGSSEGISSYRLQG